MVMVAIIIIIIITTGNNIGNDARIPIPQNFVVTGCQSNKIKFSWASFRFS